MNYFKVLVLFILFSLIYFQVFIYAQNYLNLFSNNLIKTFLSLVPCLFILLVEEPFDEK